MSLSFRHIATLFLSLTLACADAVADDSAQPNPLELSLEENIEVPAVPSKNKPAVREANDNLRSELERSGFKTSKLRQGEVLMLSIPCEQLFRANSAIIAPEGEVILKKLELLANYHNKYKILIAVHTDDTGDESYADIITSDRANSIDDFLSRQAGLGQMITIPYGIGRDEPLVANDSIKKRSQNRRVEIYIVPQTALFSKNRKK